MILYHLFPENFPIGFLGVDIFFVISGYVITPKIIKIFTDNKSRDEKLKHIKNFYVSRFWRLGPTLITVICTTIMIAIVVAPLGDWQKISNQGLLGLVSMANLGALRYSGDYFAPNPNPLLHLWSLSVEIQIYTLVPIILFTFLNRDFRENGKKSTRILGALILTSTISYLLMSKYASYQPFSKISFSEINFYSPLTRFWEFGLGGLIATFPSWKLQKRKINKPLEQISMLLGISIFFIYANMKNISTLLVACAAISAAIAIKFSSMNLLPLSIRNILIYLGDRSYSIYLIHLPIIYFAEYSTFLNPKSDQVSWFTGILILVLIFGLSSLLHKRIEERWRDKIRNHRSEKNRIKTHSLNALTLITVLVILVSKILGIQNYLADSNYPRVTEAAPWSWDKNCQFYSQAGAINRSPCVYGSTASQHKVFLIGDSHAAADSQQIVLEDMKRGITTYVFTYSACGFILKSQYKLSGNESFPWLTHDCITHNELILGLAEKERPDLVIYAHHSTSGMVLPAGRSAEAHYIRENINSLKYLGGFVKHVMIIGSEPEYISRNFLLQKFMPPHMEWRAEPFLDNEVWKNSIGSDFSYMDTIKIFCPKKKCSNKLGSSWLYHDDNHLSSDGVALIMPQLSNYYNGIGLGKYISFK